MRVDPIVDEVTGNGEELTLDVPEILWRPNNEGELAE